MSCPQSLLIPTHKTKGMIKSKHFTWFFSFYNHRSSSPSSLSLPLLNLFYSCVHCSMPSIFLKFESFSFYLFKYLAREESKFTSIRCSRVLLLPTPDLLMVLGHLGTPHRLETITSFNRSNLGPDTQMLN